MGKLMVTPAIADIHHPTPEQTSGPFFPEHNQLDKDADLTRVQGRSGKAEGDVIFVSGKILDVFGNPIEGAAIDIWQANKWGRYDHVDDDNPAPLDPNFQGWARLRSGADGSYSVMTIKPGAYPQEGDWRPPHIHFRVGRRGFRQTITQMYFKGDPLNDKDSILNDIEPKAVRDLLVVDFKAGIGKFDLVLETRRG